MMLIFLHRLHSFIGLLLLGFLLCNTKTDVMVATAFARCNRLYDTAGCKSCMTNVLCAVRQLSISRMLDMGGAPSSLNDKANTRINASKNCQVQAVAFDFHVLTTTLDASHADSANTTPSMAAPSSEGTELGKVLPDVNALKNVADLLRVNLGDASSHQKKRQEDDDLSLLTGRKKRQEDDDLSRLTGRKQVNEAQPERKRSTSDSSKIDIRSKYADKLSQRGLGGVAGVDLAKRQVEETLNKGDAGGHWAARKMALAEPSTKGKRWMAQTGTGSLLQYMTQRSIKICLLPKPSGELSNGEENEGDLMEDFKHQLKDVMFDVLLKDGDPGAPVILDQVVSKVKLNPNLILLVSDRDDYLKAAKAAGMVTCRIRPPNSRRGNISSHFMVASVPDVRSVIDEMNGISFNAVLKGR